MVIMVKAHKNCGPPALVESEANDRVCGSQQKFAAIEEDRIPEKTSANIRPLHKVGDGNCRSKSGR
jgi:hypothetical protein